MRRVGAIAALSAVLAGAPAMAAPGPETGQPLPRFATLKADRVYFRQGPGQKYAVLLELTRRHLPVLVIGEYGPWRRVVLHEGQRGWIHRAMLTGAGHVAARADGAVLRDDPSVDAKPIATAAAGFVLQLRSCEGAWCQVDAEGYRGWIERAALWGVDPRADWPFAQGPDLDAPKVGPFKQD